MAGDRARLRGRLGGDRLDAQALRYLTVGAVVAAVYFGLTLLFHAVAGLRIEPAVAIAYVVAVTLHFQLQRHVVFRRGDAYALSVRQQVGRYVAIGVVQLTLTFLGIAAVTRVTGLSQSVAYLLVTAVITVTTFLVLRARVFHAG